MVEVKCTGWNGVVGKKAKMKLMGFNTIVIGVFIIVLVGIIKFDLAEESGVDDVKTGGIDLLKNLDLCNYGMYKMYGDNGWSYEYDDYKCKKKEEFLSYDGDLTCKNPICEFEKCTNENMTKIGKRMNFMYGKNMMRNTHNAAMLGNFIYLDDNKFCELFLIDDDISELDVRGTVFNCLKGEKTKEDDRTNGENKNHDEDIETKMNTNPLMIMAFVGIILVVIILGVKLVEKNLEVLELKEMIIERNINTRKFYAAYKTIQEEFKHYKYDIESKNCTNLKTVELRLEECMDKNKHYLKIYDELVEELVNTEAASKYLAEHSTILTMEKEKVLKELDEVKVEMQSNKLQLSDITEAYNGIKNEWTNSQMKVEVLTDTVFNLEKKLEIIEDSRAELESKLSTELNKDGLKETEYVKKLEEKVAALELERQKVAALELEVEKVAALELEVEKVAALELEVEKVAALELEVEKVAALKLELLEPKNSVQALEKLVSQGNKNNLKKKKKWLCWGK